MRKLCSIVLLAGTVACLRAEEPVPLAVWEDVENPSMLTNGLALPASFTAMGWFESGSFADLAPILLYTTDVVHGTNGFGVFTTAEGAVAAFVRSQDDDHAIFAEGAEINVPQHFALAYSGTEATLYLNGIPAASTNFSFAQSLDWGGELWAGRPTDEASLPAFDGVFAGMRLYGAELTWRDVASLFVSERNVALVAAGADGARLDADADGMPDVWELCHGFNPLDASDAAGDADNDGMSNLNECLRGRSPHAGAVAADPCLIHSATEMSP